MIFMLGVVTGVFITFIGFVLVMAPKHWDWYHQTEEMKKALIERTDERDHYKNLVKPQEWGEVENHEVRIVKPKPWDGFEDLTGSGVVEYRFDDIKDGEPNV